MKNLSHKNKNKEAESQSRAPTGCGQAHRRTVADRRHLGRVRIRPQADWPDARTFVRDDGGPPHLANIAALPEVIELELFDR